MLLLLLQNLGFAGSASAAEVVSTPYQRTLMVSADDRTLAIEGDDRTLMVSADDRTLQVN